MAKHKKSKPAKLALSNPTLDPTLAARVREEAGVSWSRARTLCAEGRVTVDGERRTDAAMRVEPGSIVAVDRHAPKLETGPLSKSAIVYSDSDLVVVDKPAGMLTVADEEGTTDTLANHTRTLLRKLGGRDGQLGVVHRLDRDTSGLMVFTRSASAQKLLALQFRVHDIERVYNAIVHGSLAAQRVETFLIPDRGDGLRGSHGHFRRAKADPPGDAKRSVTHIRPLEALAGATVVECRLETGRQHQIRIHLSELGHPLVGERVYDRDYRGPVIDAGRTMLHARTLGFEHPRTRQRLSFEREPPEDFRAVVQRLLA
ncbi:MAG TPA: RluA family pseudouridine synthase [Usitatibacter sp.]|nr:RluA family pseudouridine synthase [Usitatibacter sp.]